MNYPRNPPVYWKLTCWLLIRLPLGKSVSRKNPLRVSDMPFNEKRNTQLVVVSLTSSDAQSKKERLISISNVWRHPAFSRDMGGSSKSLRPAHGRRERSQQPAHGRRKTVYYYTLYNPDCLSKTIMIVNMSKGCVPRVIFLRVEFTRSVYKSTRLAHAHLG